MPAKGPFRLPAELERIRPPQFSADGLEPLLSPALVAFRERIEHNIATMKRLLGDFQTLRPHIKTHKCGWILRRLMKEGLTKIKAATLREIELSLEVGLRDVLLAHAPIGAKAPGLAALARRFPDARVSAIFEESTVLKGLARAAREAGVTLGVRIDLDPGMRRTGIETTESALALARQADALEGVRFEGLHAYDGHVKSGVEDRRQQFEAIVKQAGAIKHAIESAGIECAVVSHSGSSTFQFCPGHENVTECTPGTWIYWDLGYIQALGDLDFQPAIYVMGRVVSNSVAGQVTLDAGNKAISTDQAADPGVLVHPVTGTVSGLSEEHGVFTLADGETAPPVGAAALICPRHVCSTVHLFDEMALVDPDGSVQIVPIEASTRILKAREGA